MASIAIMGFGMIVCVVVYYIAQIGRHLAEISKNVETASGDIKEHIHDFFDRLSIIPIISSFFRKSRSDKKP